jgi:ribonuclease Z
MTQIEVTFLGTTAGIPTPHRNHASIYVRYQSENEYACLFDCGEGTQRQIFAAGLNFMKIDDIFISHWHADHFAGLLGLMETFNLEKRTKPLNIFGPEADRFVDTLLDLGYASKRYDVVAKPVPFEGNEITTLLDMGEFTICSIPAKHGIPAVAYALVEKDRVKINKAKLKEMGLPEKGPIYKKLKEKGSAVINGKTVKLEDVADIEKGKKVVYSGDTMPCKNVVILAHEADLLIHDSTFFEEDVFDKQYRHTTFEDVLDIIKHSKVKQAVLTHISRRYQNVELLKEKISGFQNVKVAKDFMKIEIK